MGRRAPKDWVKRMLTKQANKYTGIEFRVIYASNGETAILPVDPTTDELSTENPRKLQVKMLWNKMCAADGIDPTSQFVVFTDHNPISAEYNEAVGLLMDGR